MSESSGPKKENKSHVMKIDSPGQVLSSHSRSTYVVRCWIKTEQCVAVTNRFKMTIFVK